MYVNRFGELPTPKKKNKKFPRWLALLAIVIIGGALYQAKDGRAQTIVPARPAIQSLADNEWQGIQTSLQGVINSSPDIQIAVSVIDLGSQMQKKYGVSEPYEAASTNKVLSAVAFLKDVEAGKQSLTKQLGDYDAKYQLEQMVNQSNNDSWLLINQQTTHQRLNDLAKSIGLTSYNADENLITASDQATMFAKLYEGKLLNQQNTKYLLSLMQKTNDDSMIPSVAPEGAKVYHKYGALDDRLHDVAIVAYGNRQMVLSIYTKSNPGRDIGYNARVQLVKDLAKAVFSEVASSK